MNNPAIVDALTEAETSVLCSVLVTRLGGSYSRLLGIGLAGMQSDDAFRWFVAAVLLGSPASTGSALSAYREMEASELLEPKRLAAADPEALIDLLSVAGISAYGRRIAETLRMAARSLVDDYDADINRLHFFAEDADDLVRHMRALGRTVPRRVVDLFLREMRGVWDKADPRVSDHALEAARRLRILRACGRDEAAVSLQSLWERINHGGRTYADFEVALVRLGETFCETWRCGACPMSKLCVSRKAALWTDQERYGAAFRRTELSGEMMEKEVNSMAQKGQPAKPAPKPGAKK